MAERALAKKMKKVAVAAGDIRTSLGNLPSTWQNLMAGVSGLVRKKSQVVSTEYPLGLVEGLEGTGGSWLRLQSFLDLLLANVPDLPADTDLIVATTKAAVDEQLQVGGAKEGQPWQLAEILKKRLHLSGEATTVSAACASGTLAIIQGAMKIMTGSCNQVLVVGIDLVGDFILSGFDSLKALSPSTPKPFDKNRDGLALGDGGGWILLSADDRVGSSSSSVLGWVEGWGISCDATHITAPCRKGSGLKRAFDQLLMSTSSPLGGINGHGTGTVYNDAMELLVFGDKCDPGIPVCSVKGAVGHSLGAAGVVEALLSLQSLAEMVLPPTVGLETPEAGMVNLSGTRALSLVAPSIVSCNSGFGGINAAVHFTL